MRSLKERLGVTLGVTISVIGVVAGEFAYRWAFDEAIEMQDALLLQAGAVAIRSPELPLTSLEHGVDREASIVIEEIGRSTGGILGPLPATLPDGLQTLTHNATSWRVLIRSRDDRRRIAIGQSTASRQETARDSAIRAVLPLALLFPLLLLLVGLILNVSFRSIWALASTLDAKQVDALDKLPLSDLPDELVPFVRSINGLLQRISLMLDHQRRFIAVAAHELRTPITALSLQAENFSETGFSPKYAEQLLLLKNGIRRLAHLLEQLLAASKYEGGTSRLAAVTALDCVAKGVVADHLKAASKRGIDLGFNKIEKVFVRADPTSLAVLVRNLLENALRHTPDGGRIDLEVAVVLGLAQLKVEDTGPGIAEEHLARVFEPFFRCVEDGGQGSGLGLTIVHSIVRQAGGSIMLENMTAEARTGLRVLIVFPLHERHTAKDISFP